MPHVISKYIDEHVTLLLGPSRQGPQGLCTTCMMVPRTMTRYLKPQTVDLGATSSM